MVSSIRVSASGTSHLTYRSQYPAIAIRKVVRIDRIGKFNRSANQNGIDDFVHKLLSQVAPLHHFPANSVSAAPSKCRKRALFR